MVSPLSWFVEALLFIKETFSTLAAPSAQNPVRSPRPWTHESSSKIYCPEMDNFVNGTIHLQSLNLCIICIDVKT